MTINNLDLFKEELDQAVSELEAEGYFEKLRQKAGQSGFSKDIELIESSNKPKKGLVVADKKHT